MDKISRILPATARVQTADVSTSQPARPGTSASGRVEGHASGAPVEVQDRVSLSSVSKAADNMPNYKNSVENARSKVIDDLAKKFFDTSALKENLGDQSGAEKISGIVNDPVTIAEHAKLSEASSRA